MDICKINRLYEEILKSENSRFSKAGMSGFKRLNIHQPIGKDCDPTLAFLTRLNTISYIFDSKAVDKFLSSFDLENEMALLSEESELHSQYIKCITNLSWASELSSTKHFECILDKLVRIDKENGKNALADVVQLIMDISNFTNPLVFELVMRKCDKLDINPSTILDNIYLDHFSENYICDASYITAKNNITELSVVMLLNAYVRSDYEYLNKVSQAPLLKQVEIISEISDKMTWLGVWMIYSLDLLRELKEAGFNDEFNKVLSHLSTKNRIAYYLMDDLVFSKEDFLDDLHIYISAIYQDFIDGDELVFNISPGQSLWNIRESMQILIDEISSLEHNINNGMSNAEMLEKCKNSYAKVNAINSKQNVYKIDILDKRKNKNEKPEA